MNRGSGGEAVGSMVDANDKMWENLLAFPDMDVNSSLSGLKGRAQLQEELA